MSVRKIPLKEQPALNPDGSPRLNNEDDAEDPEIPQTLSKIRSTVLKDRALHDKVSASTSVLPKILNNRYLYRL